MPLLFPKRERFMNTYWEEDEDRLTLEEVFGKFLRPPIEFRPIPFWSLNDLLEEKEIQEQLAEMRKGGFGGGFLHARIGLRTPYLSEEWMSSLDIAIDTCTHLGLKAWLYDEDRWPSGFAGGIVPEMDESYQQKLLILTPTQEESKYRELLVEQVNLFRIDTQNYTPVDEKADATHIALIIKAPKIPWFNNNPYVDLMNPKVTDAFIASTYQPYFERYKDAIRLGVVPGIFTDEPNVAPRDFRGRSLPWTPMLPHIFKKRYGYRIEDRLPELFYDVGEYRRTRIHYWSLIGELFSINYSKRLFDWCEKHGLLYTGHYLCEEEMWKSIPRNGDVMAHYEYMHIPGYDHLGRHLLPSIGYRQVSSVAHQMNRKRVLCEIFGTSGWDTKLEDYKWMVDWNLVNGINFFNPHLVLYSLRGCRKRDYPPSLFKHQPWWKYHRVLADYIAGVSYILTLGKYLADVGVLHPMSTGWMKYAVMDHLKVVELDKAFQEFAERLMKAQVHFDFLSEGMLKKYGKIENSHLKLGEMKYSTVIIPPFIENVLPSTLKILRKFAKSGGRLIIVGSTPRYVEGEESEISIENAEIIPITQLEKVLKDLSPIEINGTGCEDVYTHLREFNGVRLCFITNLSKEAEARMQITLKGWKAVSLWDINRRSRYKVTYKRSDEDVVLNLVLEPLASTLLVEESVEYYPPLPEIKPVSEVSDWKVEILDYNALPLDFCRWSTDGKSWSEPTYVLSIQEDLEKENYEGPIYLRYEFRSDIDGTAMVAYEDSGSPDVYVNGEKVKEVPFKWIDPVYKVCEFKLKKGKNTVEIKAHFKPPKKPKTLLFVKDGMEIETIYILGDFTVDFEDKKPYISGPKKTPIPGDITSQGYPFYAGLIRYTSTFRVEEGGTYLLKVDRYNGVAMGVMVNGVYAGVAAWPPRVIDISTHIKKGVNTLTLELATSLRNLYGPHHTAGIGPSVGPTSFLELSSRRVPPTKVRWIDEYLLVPVGFEGKVVLLKEIH